MNSIYQHLVKNPDRKFVLRPVRKETAGDVSKWRAEILTNVGEVRIHWGTNEPTPSQAVASLEYLLGKVANLPTGRPG